MAVKGITIDTTSAASPHIYAYDQALINNAIIGGDAVHEMFDNLLATKVSNNIVTIYPGTFSIQGHFGNVVYGTTEPMTIENGTAGQKRNDLICAKFKRTIDTDVISLVVVKGTNDPSTPVDPTITQQDLLAGGTERLFPLWRVSLDGIDITTLTQLFTVQKNLNVFKDSLAPVTSEAFAKQDINGFRTVTYSATATATVNILIYGVYVADVLFTLPPGFRFSANEVAEISILSATVLNVAPAEVNIASGQIIFRVYCHFNAGVQTFRVNAVITGRI